MSVQLLQPSAEPEWRRARALIEEYAASLALDLSFQNIAHELEHLQTEYSPPEGALFIAMDGDDAVGCAGLRRFDAGAGEVKRLYVAPRGRGRGAGRRLAQAVIDAGRSAGYERLLLDTLPSMTEALALYAVLGFVPVPAYRFNPVPGAVFMQLTLDVSAPYREVRPSCGADSAPS